MEGEDLYSIVVPANGVTFSLLSGALVPSSRTRRKNKNCGSPVSRPSPGRSRLRELSTNIRRRATSKLRSKSRSQSSSRRKKTSCSPNRRKSPDSKSPRRERRSCSLNSTCSKYCGCGSPNRNSPQSPSSKTPLESPDRTSSRNATVALTANTNEVIINDCSKQEEKRSVTSTSEIALVPIAHANVTPFAKSDPKTIKNLNRYSLKKKHTDITMHTPTDISSRTQEPEENKRSYKARDDCFEASPQTLLPADAVVNYVSEWRDCVKTLKSFCSDPIDCYGVDACPPLRERMAQHRLMHHSGRRFESRRASRGNSKRYAFEDRGPAIDSQIRERNIIPTRKMVDRPVQTKLTLGDLGEIVIKLGKPNNVSNGKDKDSKKHRRSTYNGIKDAHDKSQRNIDYKKHRLSRLDSNHDIYGNIKKNNEIDNGTQKTDLNNGGRETNNSYSRSKEYTSITRHSPSNDKGSFNGQSEDKSIYYDKIHENKSYDERSKCYQTDDIKNQDRIDKDGYKEHSTNPNEFSFKGKANKEQTYKYRHKGQNYWLRKTQEKTEENLYSHRNSRNDRKKRKSNKYKISKRNRDYITATSSKFQSSNVSNGSNDILNNMDDNNYKDNNDILLVNNARYDLLAPISNKNELSEAVQLWLENFLSYPETSNKDTTINELIEKINDLLHVPIKWEEFDQIVKGLVSEYLDNLHTWYPGDKKDQDEYKSNLIKSLVHKIKALFNQNINDNLQTNNYEQNNRDNLHLGLTKQRHGLVGSKRASGEQSSKMEYCHRSKKTHKRVLKRCMGDRLIGYNSSNKVLCGDNTVRKMKQSEKYRPEFALEICNWLARNNFNNKLQLQQISMHDLVGILLNRLTPYLDRPYNSTNKLTLKSKIFDIINNLPIFIHHSPQQKTQIIKLADELANLLLNIQTRFDNNNSNKYSDLPLTRRTELMYISSAVEACKKYHLRTQISEQLRKCLQNTALSNKLCIQTQLTEVVMNYFELLQLGQNDITKKAVMNVLQESNLAENDKLSIVNSIIGSLEALAVEKSVEDTIKTKLLSRKSVSRLSVYVSEMEVRETVFPVSTKGSRFKQEPGLSKEENEYFETVADVIRDWTMTLPESFSKLKRRQRKEFIYELAKDILIQNIIEKISPILGIEREKFWSFFAYRWLYRFNLFEDLNNAEPYSEELCKKINEALEARILAETSPSKEADEILNDLQKNETETDSSTISSTDNRKTRLKDRSEEIKKIKKEKEEEKAIRLLAREEAKQKRSKEKEEAKQRRLREKEEAKQTRLKEREQNRSKLGKKRGRSDESESSKPEEKNEVTEELVPEIAETFQPKRYDECTENCKKMNIIQTTDGPQITLNPNEKLNWQCTTLSFQCPQLNQDPNPDKTTLHSTDPLSSYFKTSTTLPPAKTIAPLEMPPSAILPSPLTPIKPLPLPETHCLPHPRQTSNIRQKNGRSQQCPCLRHHKHNNRTRNKEYPNVRDTEICDETQTPYQKLLICEKLVQTSSLHIKPQNPGLRDLNASTISKSQERYHQIFKINNLNDQAVSLLSHPTSNKHTKSPQNINMQLGQDSIIVMKEFIKKYLEYKYNMDDPLVRATFFHVLIRELQKTKAYYMEKESTRQPSTSKSVEEELEYIKLISDWLKKIPVEKSFNTTMNKDRIFLVKDLAQNIAQIQLDKLRAPNIMNYDMYLERIIKRCVIQLPLKPEQQGQILAMIEQLIDTVNTKPQYTDYFMGISSKDSLITEQNLLEFLDKHIRRNGEQLKYDELTLDIWSHRLVEEVLKSIPDRSLNVVQTWQVFNILVGPYIPDNPAFRFRLKLDYAKEILEFLNSLPLLSIPIETIVDKVHELTEKLVLRDIKITKNPNDNRADQELTEFIEKWIADFPLNFDKEKNVLDAVYNFGESINRLSDNSYSEHFKDNTNGTELFNEATILHYKGISNTASIHVIAQIIEKWSHFLPIEGYSGESIKLIKANISKLLFQKICDLQANRKIYYDIFSYKRHLEVEIDTQLNEIPENAALMSEKNYLKAILVNKLIEIKNGAPDKKVGDAYKKALEAALEAALKDVMPLAKTRCQNTFFEIYKHQLINKFLLENFDFSKHPAKLKYKQRIQLGIKKHFQNVLNQCESTLSLDVINNELYGVLFKVPVPANNSLKYEVECIKTRCEIDDWFDTLPLRKTPNPTKFAEWDHTLMSLARNVHDIEQEPGRNYKIHKEISRQLKKFPLELDYEHHRPDLAYKLQTQLASTYEARLCVTLEEQSPESSFIQISNNTPCQTYRLELSNIIDGVLYKPDDLTTDKKIIVEIIKGEIIDGFMEYNYNKNNDEIKRNCKKKIVESVFEYLDFVKNENETIPLNIPLVKGNKLIGEMSKVAEPSVLAINKEIQEVKMMYEVNDFFGKLLTKASEFQLAVKNNFNPNLATKLHEIEKTNHSVEITQKLIEKILKAKKKKGYIIQEKKYEFISNLKKNEVIRKAPRLGLFYSDYVHKTLSRVSINQIYGTSGRPQATTYRSNLKSTGPEMQSKTCSGFRSSLFGGHPNSNRAPATPCYAHSSNIAIENDIKDDDNTKDSEDYFRLLRSFSSHTGLTLNNCNIPIANKNFHMPVNPRNRQSFQESVRKTSLTQYGNPTCKGNLNFPPHHNDANSCGKFTQRKAMTGGHKTFVSESVVPPNWQGHSGSEKQAAVQVQGYGCGQPPLQQNSTMGFHVMQASEPAHPFEGHCGQEVQPQSENITKSYEVQQTLTKKNFFCSCSVSKFENCCGQYQNTTQTPTENTSTCGQDNTVQEAHNVDRGCGSQHIPFGAFSGQMTFIPQLQNCSTTQDIKNRCEQTSQYAEREQNTSQEADTQQLTPCDQTALLQQGHNAPQDCGVAQLSLGSSTNRFGQVNDKTSQSHVCGTPQNIDSHCGQPAAQASAAQQDQRAPGQKTTSSQTVAVQIIEQGVGAHTFSLEALSSQCAQISYRPPQSQQLSNQMARMPAPSTESWQANDVVQSSVAAKVLSQYIIGSENAINGLPPEKQKPTNVPQNCNPNHPGQPNNPSNCNFNQLLPESIPDVLIAKQNHLPEHPEQPRCSLSQQQTQPIKSSCSQNRPNSKQEKKRPLQNQPYQYPLLHIPDDTENSSNRRNYAYLGSLRHVMIGFPRQSRSLSPGHYQLFSPLAGPGLQKQYLYTSKRGTSCYTQVSHPDYTHINQNTSAGVQNYYFQPQKVSAGCSNVQTHMYQSAGTSTTTSAGPGQKCNAETTCEGCTNFGDEFCGQCIQEDKNNHQNLYNQYVHDPCCGPDRSRLNSPHSSMGRCSPYTQDGRATGKNCSHTECGDYPICTYCKIIPVLQNCDSIEDFLSTWLPQKWLRFSRKEKK